MKSRAVVATVVAIVAASVAAAGVASAESRAAGAVVRTEAGPVRGMVAEDHRTFQGVPFAAPPVGERRWAAPRPVGRWDQPRDATRPGSSCPQDGRELGIPSVTEDCLYLNVTTPKPGRSKRPVLVWLHGGSFQDGAGSSYGARRLATRGDLVVVTVNYRLGAFGFLTHPLINDDNLGLRDQQAALRWVQRNIAAFGGDPGNVTLAGESAGATAVCAHLAAPASAGLFHRAIMQSGPCTRQYAPDNNSLPRSREMAEQQGHAVVDALGCTDLRCLRAQPVERIQTAAQHGEGTGPVFGTPTLPIEPAIALSAGLVHRVPVLQGINHDEERFMVYGMELAQQRPLTHADYVSAVRDTFGGNADRVLAEYPCADDTCAALTLATIRTDHLWAAPAVRAQRHFARLAPAYGYEFADENAPWLKGFPPARFPTGAYHTAELPYLFDVPWSLPLSDKQRRLANTMIDHWAAFACTGRPGWPQSRPGDHVQRLTSETSGPTDFARDHRFTFWSSVGA